MTFDEELARLRQAKPPKALTDMLGRVFGPGLLWEKLEPEEFSDKALDEDFRGCETASLEDAVKDMRAEWRPYRSAHTRRLNKSLREKGLNPKHFERLVIRHHSFTPEQWRALIKDHLSQSDEEWVNHLGHKTSDRNEHSKKTHEPRG